MININALKKFIPKLSTEQKEEIILALLASMKVEECAHLLEALTKR